MIGTKIATALVSFGVTMGLGMIGQAAAEPATITEDSPGWDCRTMGNLICGPTNDQGVTAGCYAEDGFLVDTWPCSVVVHDDGSRTVYEGGAR